MLIMAYNNFEMLKLLISTLDYRDNDIFVHIDKKCGEVDFLQFENITKYSKVKCLRDRINVNWGGYSQIETEMRLFDEAFNNREGCKYDYFHLLSGVDFPLKSNEYISHFLERNRGKEFIGFAKGCRDTFYFRLGVYHLLAGRKWRRLDKYVLFPIQRMLGINRHRDYSKFRYGANWVSITYDLVAALLKDKQRIRKMYQFTSCCDEVFIQTYVYNHENFLKNVYCLDNEFQSCMRFIDWNRGNPYTFQSADLEELLSSNALFARKFSPECLGMLKILKKKMK